MKHATILILLATLAGCSVTGQLENRVACTVARDGARYVSEYGPLGIASKIDAKDAAVICGAAAAK